MNTVVDAPHLLRDSPAAALNADLHCHSTISDGTLEPEVLAARARANGVQLWALTDHDEVSGQARARRAAHAVGMDYLAGVEISVTWAGKTVHILGLGIDAENAVLRDGLAHTRDGRNRRAQAMARSLEAAGIPGAYEGALAHVGNPSLISRTHFARYLVDLGVCASTNEVFQRFLVEGRPGYVPHEWARLSDALGWIAAAGGVALIAHPGRYHLDALRENALFDEFVALGGRGVEVVTSVHPPEMQSRYAQVARERGLCATRGSDFHAPGEMRGDLGVLPPLPAGLTPVWDVLADRIAPAPRTA